MRAHRRAPTDQDLQMQKPNFCFVICAKLRHHWSTINARSQPAVTSAIFWWGGREGQAEDPTTQPLWQRTQIEEGDNEAIWLKAVQVSVDAVSSPYPAYDVHTRAANVDAAARSPTGQRHNQKQQVQHGWSQEALDLRRFLQQQQVATCQRVGYSSTNILRSAARCWEWWIGASATQTSTPSKRRQSDKVYSLAICLCNWLHQQRANTFSECWDAASDKRAKEVEQLQSTRVSGNHIVSLQ